MPETWFRESDHHGRGDVSDRSEQSPVVEPVHPFQRRELDLFDVPPWTAPPDDLALVQAEGTPLKWIQEQGGWTTAKLLLDTYGHYNAERDTRLRGRTFDGPRRRWMTFLRNHQDCITAMDFFVVPTVGFRLLYVWFIIDHGRRRILHFDVTTNPTAQWVIQQLREAFPYDSAPGYLIYDNDSILSKEVTEAIQYLGMEPKRTAYRSPWICAACSATMSSTTTPSASIPG